MKQNNGKKVLFSATVYLHLAAFHKPFMKMLQRNGFEVHAAANPHFGRKDEIEELGVKCWDIPFSRSPYTKHNWKAYKELKSLFEENYFDLIHVHTPVASFLVRYLAKRNKQGPVLYTAHGFHFFKGAPLTNWLLYYSAERIASRWTDGLIVMNNEDYSNGIKMGFIPNETLFSTRGVGIDIESYSYKEKSEIRKELNIPEDHIVITCVAELCSRKNQLYLLEAWKELSTMHKHIHLLLVGDGGMETELTEFANNKGLRNVHFAGYRTGIPSIISSSDIMTLVSKQEGLPRCIMEAMACSKPSVVTNVRGSRDLVEHGVTGYVVELDDKEQLVQSFHALIQDKEKRIQMGQAAFEKIQGYALQNVSGQLDSIYRKYVTQ
ncbi:glycosyltransferase family 4 protein [Bacillus sp. 165]|uniref:glycosyltransferase family 4 protein n=1 Tax=Bacillus sp. 165 TaxID=1529117 RepID=UPI001ADAEB24|nr:glycosyltransferase family 4 protein [Bacillus sp. 165]MBO9130003.1 glycosyltransferase family 4 protein [Bacillus sp. 165]